MKLIEIIQKKLSESKEKPLGILTGTKFYGNLRHEFFTHYGYALEDEFPSQGKMFGIPIFLPVTEHRDMCWFLFSNGNTKLIFNGEKREFNND